MNYREYLTGATNKGIAISVAAMELFNSLLMTIAVVACTGLLAAIRFKCYMRSDS